MTVNILATLVVYLKVRFSTEGRIQSKLHLSWCPSFYDSQMIYNQKNQESNESYSPNLEENSAVQIPFQIYYTVHFRLSWLVQDTIIFLQIMYHISQMSSLCQLLMYYRAFQVLPMLKQLNPIPKWLLSWISPYSPCCQGLGLSKGYMRHFYSTGRQDTISGRHLPFWSLS